MNALWSVVLGVSLAFVLVGMGPAGWLLLALCFVVSVLEIGVELGKLAMLLVQLIFWVVVWLGARSCERGRA